MVAFVFLISSNSFFNKSILAVALAVSVSCCNCKCFISSLWFSNTCFISFFPFSLMTVLFSTIVEYFSDNCSNLIFLCLLSLFRFSLSTTIASFSCCNCCTCNCNALTSSTIDAAVVVAVAVAFFAAA